MSKKIKIKFEELKLSDELTTESNKDREYYFYDYNLKNPIEYDKKVSNIYALKVNLISKVYQKTGLICGLIGLISYLVYSFIALFKKHRLVEKWLIVTSVLCVYLVLCLGITYNNIATCPSITSMYLSGSYGLIIIFNALSII